MPAPQIKSFELIGGCGARFWTDVAAIAVSHRRPAQRVNRVVRDCKESLAIAAQKAVGRVLEKCLSECSTSRIGSFKVLGQFVDGEQAVIKVVVLDRAAVSFSAAEQCFQRPSLSSGPQQPSCLSVSDFDTPQRP